MGAAAARSGLGSIFNPRFLSLVLLLTFALGFSYLLSSNDGLGGLGVAFFDCPGTLLGAGLPRLPILQWSL